VEGVNRANNYFYFALQPGRTILLLHGQLQRFAARVEAGKTYYLQQHVRMGKKELTAS